jgi:PKHD-type hydroxylase
MNGLTRSISLLLARSPLTTMWVDARRLVERFPMLLPIPKVVPADQVGEIQSAIRAGSFVSGKSSAVGSAARVKNNLQLPTQTAEGRRGSQLLLAALRASTAFQAAAYPAAMTTPSFCKYEPGMSYGDHIDSPLMGSTPLLRCDIAVTVCLSDPSSYDGGELVIDIAGVPQRWKGDAGDGLLYPADTLHRVEPVTRGERVVAVFWIQSLIREPGNRRILFDLAEVLEHLDRHTPPGPHIEKLRRSYMNLIRLWSDSPPGSHVGLPS